MAVNEQKRDFLERRFLGKVVDGIPAIGQSHPFFADRADARLPGDDAG